MKEDNLYQSPTSDVVISPPDSANTSGLGKDSTIPDEIKGFCWGGLLLNWIWAIGNRVWLGLLTLVPYIGFIFIIVLLVKGREWAWKAKRWDSIDHFNKVQRLWTIWGLIILAIPIVILIAVVIILELQ